MIEYNKFSSPYEDLHLSIHIQAKVCSVQKSLCVVHLFLKISIFQNFREMGHLMQICVVFEITFWKKMSKTTPLSPNPFNQESENQL